METHAFRGDLTDWLYTLSQHFVDRSRKKNCELTWTNSHTQMKVKHTIFLWGCFFIHLLSSKNEQYITALSLSEDLSQLTHHTTVPYLTI